MPFGIAAASGTFQALMTKVLGNLKEAIVYLDDILIFTRDKVEHIRVLKEVLQKIKEAKNCVSLWHGSSSSMASKSSSSNLVGAPSRFLSSKLKLRFLNLLKHF